MQQGDDWYASSEKGVEKMLGRGVFSILAVLILMCVSSYGRAEWRPVEGRIMTRWAEEVSPENALPEYPRPMMVRKQWQNLNGVWEYAIRPRQEAQPESYDGDILVPFPIESALSGVQKPIGEDKRLWYRRQFQVPDEWNGNRVLLHFGGVDWETTAWVNGKEVGAHRGCYDRFHFDITDALNPAADQEIVLAVWDPTDKGFQARGKQVSEPQGIWYTAVTGIWQTVWLEPVPDSSVEALKMVPDIDAGVLEISVQCRGTEATDTVLAVATADGKRVATALAPVGNPIALMIDEPRLWSPDSPFLYDVEITLQRDGNTLDEVTSYFGMRKIALGKDPDGVSRLFLNNEPLFQIGPLDQGWWPDGLYTAPTDDALRYDVEITRKLGYNMARKHVKIEPARWYYHCDQLGLLVWQDMPSGDKYIGRNDPDIERSEESERQFRNEYKSLIDNFGNHPSIVMWVIFNEGWGQFDTAGLTAWTKKYDPSRLVDQASGWTDRGGADVHDIHSYPGPAMPATEPTRAAVLGEFGGLGIPVEGHLWWDKRNWGYRSFETTDELANGYSGLIFRLRPLIGRGLAAAVYTQTTDVEGEVNGLMTYDRALVKMGVERLAAMNARVFLPPPIVETVVPTSGKKAQVWRYTTGKPPEGWQSPDFDDSSWNTGPGVFGTKGTPGAVVRTRWDTKYIWLRRTFVLDQSEVDSLWLNILHDEDAHVYLNGVRAANTKGHSTNYVPVQIAAEARAALKAGENTIAVRCRQTEGGQSIDVGLIRYEER